MREPMNTILKSCPFCGSDKVDGIFIRDGWRIGCRDCSAGVPAYHPNAHTVSADKWNRRSDSDLIEERDRLREAIIEACDLLMERKQGSLTRSPSHNARLRLEEAIGHWNG